MSADDRAVEPALQPEGDPEPCPCRPVGDGASAPRSSRSNVVRLNRGAESSHEGRAFKMRVTPSSLSRQEKKTNSSHGHAGIGEIGERVFLLEDHLRNRGAAHLDLTAMEGSPTRGATVLTSIEEYPPLEARTMLQKQSNSRSGVESAASTLKSFITLMTGAAGAMTGVAVEKVLDAPARLVIPASIGVFCSVIGFSTLLNLWISRNS